MFEKEALVYATVSLPDGYTKIDYQKKTDWQKGAEFGYNKAKEEMVQNGLALQSDMDKTIEQNIALKKELEKANEWFDARTSIPLPKKAEIYRYTLEVISDKGDIVCYDYKDKNWKKLVIEDEKVTYVPVEVERWCNKPTKESE